MVNMGLTIDREAYRSVLQSIKQGSAQQIWLINCRVLNTKIGTFSSEHNILIVGDKIQKVGDEAPASDAVAYDCQGRFVVPGELVDGGGVRLGPVFCSSAPALADQPVCHNQSSLCTMQRCKMLKAFVTGLCDAHVHCTASTANLSSLMSLPESLVTAHAAVELEQMLARGFTTVRDAGMRLLPTAGIA